MLIQSQVFSKMNPGMILIILIIFFIVFNILFEVALPNDLVIHKFPRFERIYADLTVYLYLMSYMNKNFS